MMEYNHRLCKLKHLNFYWKDKGKQMSEIQWSTTANNLITICDMRNNFLWFDRNNGSLSLKLSNEQRHSRKIGSIWSLDDETRVYCKIVNPKKHYHRNTGSYGLNSIVINNILNDTDIVLLYL